MSGQHCLYCERPLALLSRLTGAGEFCSKEHRRLYQKEHSQMALARLLQAQPQGPGRGPQRAATVESVVRAPEPAASRVEVRKAPDPAAAAFVKEPVTAAPLSGPVRLGPPPQAEAEALRPRWRHLPQCRIPPLPAGVQPKVREFLSPGCFLRRKTQPAAPDPVSITRGEIKVSAAVWTPQLDYLEHGMVRAERVGFGPP